MIARYWQHNERACLQGDRPQTPYDGFRRSDRAIDGDWNWRPCAAQGKRSNNQPREQRMAK